MPNPDETRHILIENLKAATILLGFAGIAESTGAIEDFGEGFEIDYIYFFFKYQPFVCLSLLLRYFFNSSQIFPTRFFSPRNSTSARAKNNNNNNKSEKKVKAYNPPRRSFPNR